MSDLVPQSVATFDDASADVPYRAPSVLAIAAFLLGILSPLAFVHPVVWVLPAVGVGVALAALARIKQSDGALIGRPAAVAGLLLALTFGLAAPVYAVSRTIWLEHRAQQVSEQFFQLLREGRKYEAHQLTLHPDLRFPPGSAYEGAYEESGEAQKSLDKFLEREAVATVLKLTPEAEIVPHEVAVEIAAPDLDRIQLDYDIHGVTVNGRQIDAHVPITIDRVKNRKTGGWVWVVVGFHHLTGNAS